MKTSLRTGFAALLGFVLLALTAWGQAATLTPADRLLDHIEQATYVAEGHGPRLLYVFFDPNCPYCHSLYQNLRPWVGKGGLQVRWIPVGILTSSSEPKAAAILQAPSPLVALRKNEDDFGFSDDAGGGIAPASRIGAKAQQELAANSALMQSQRIYGVPVLLYRDRSGRGQLLVGGPASPAELRALLDRIK
ncbi:thiol:disulfide interchange protein DsbG [Thiobacillus sp.]|uniref:thiol:disulfide interchange protein DsbG n=1 Tax=Thiobacillus sp. TaxID=924 RepID=UPI0011D2FE6E|nr:thiol:disulfide interchange protein DsbG [Thiobacillus sp.]TXH73975.1 MAG: thiol:disulfide interchange protein DsbG [Thiobacillus sp.]